MPLKDALNDLSDRLRQLESNTRNMAEEGREDRLQIRPSKNINVEHYQHIENIAQQARILVEGISGENTPRTHDELNRMKELGTLMAKSVKLEKDNKNIWLVDAARAVVDMVMPVVQDYPVELKPVRDAYNDTFVKGRWGCSNPIGWFFGR